jgi:hypothetical protein
VNSSIVLIPPKYSGYICLIKHGTTRITLLYHHIGEFLAF